jgi:hypothetical protein
VAQFLAPRTMPEFRIGNKEGKKTGRLSSAFLMRCNPDGHLKKRCSLKIETGLLSLKAITNTF